MTDEKLKNIFENIQMQMILEQNTSCRNEYSKPLQERIDLYNYVIELKEKLEQKNKVIKEGNKWVTNYKLKWDFDDETGLELNELLDILNKGVDE